MEPRYNEPLHTEGLGIMNEFLYPGNSNNFLEKEPGYYKTLLGGTNFASPLVKLRFHRTCVDVTNNIHGVEEGGGGREDSRIKHSSKISLLS